MMATLIGAFVAGLAACFFSLLLLARLRAGRGTLSRRLAGLRRSEAPAKLRQGGHNSIEPVHETALAVKRGSNGKETIHAL
ncbi:MAG: hypothetical protein V3U18_08380 [Alphaproteobacteria bacterium]|jgi:hypothetical protein